ncbi:hypothetical protein PF004_g27557 [Phytophthora fragariae]|uniref:Uncharacterized protein n=1 Tax=Phytophthora fragariae TaxID=53985 RepID=A0A6G0MK75_9STRA|nr:hypothetical protein PF004_g27557 [Phytophthora fragariae]
MQDVRILQRSVRARRENLCLAWTTFAPRRQRSAGLDTSILSEASDQDFAATCNNDDEFMSISLEKTAKAHPILRFHYALTVRADPTTQHAVFAANIFKRLENVSIEQHHVLRMTLDDPLENSSEVARLLSTRWSSTKRYERLQSVVSSIS